MSAGGKVILRDIDPGKIERQIQVLETFGREAMPDDSLEAQELNETIALLKKILKQARDPLKVVP
jgi:hypothetical protein